MANDRTTPIIEVRDLVVDLKGNRILNGVTLDVYRGEIFWIRRRVRSGQIGPHAYDLRSIAEAAGTHRCLRCDLDQAGEAQRQAIERRWGILFQQGALFSSLTVGQNVEFPIREYLDISDNLMTEMAITKLEMVGLKPDVYRKFRRSFRAA